tara:strand:- start:1750 stop:2472 length:723 start_codon:yes stop_codon:yes gene_type:complete
MNIENISKPKIFIGYDHREHEAYKICKYSLTRLGYYDFEIVKLRSEDISEYNRNTGEPQSTDFTFTRFWLPYLCNYKGFSIFVDCDFLFLKDPIEMMKEIDKNKAVSVVKHPKYIPNSKIKMDDIQQNTYDRKNWSSLMVFNNSHISNKTFLQPNNLNTRVPGLHFHQFKWLNDDDIGNLSIKWNVLDDYYYMNRNEIGAIHYTDGGPWFKDYKKTMYSDIWRKMKDEFRNTEERYNLVY